MNQETFSHLEQLIDQLISRNNQLEQEIAGLKQANSKLADENETLQLEILENEEKQSETSSALAGLLEKLQNAAG